MLNRCHFLIGFSILTVSSLPALHAQQNELRSLAASLAEDIASSGKKTIAVVDFVDLEGKSCDLGRFLAEELSVGLLRTRKGFDVVERNQLRAVLNEHKLTATGVIDPTIAKKIGQFTGADIIVTGSMTPFSESVRLAVKALATDTARIIAADDADLPKTSTISELLAACAGGTRVPGGGTPTSAPIADPRAASVPPRPTPTSGARSVVTEQFVFELIQCKGLGDSVICSFQTTNHSADRILTLYCLRSEASRAIDNSGNQSSDTDCSIANRGVYGTTGNAQATLVQGVSVPARFVFSHLSPSATSLALITLMGRVNIPGDAFNGREFKAELRNIPVLR